jgi:hypothetical protein
MFRFDRLLPAALVLALGLTLSACESFDPTDMMPNNWFGGGKKPLPGERRAVFPEGTPGVPQGVPPELTKGYQQPTEEPPPVIAAPAPKPAPAQRAKPKPKTANASQTQAPKSASPWPDAPAQKPSSQNAWPPPDANTFSR